MNDLMNLRVPNYLAIGEPFAIVNSEIAALQAELFQEAVTRLIHEVIWHGSDLE